MQNVYKLSRFMTAAPHTINACSRLPEAMAMMRVNGFRHLPVLKGGHLVGILSDGDINWARAFDNDVCFSVEDAMTPDPFTLPEDANLFDAIKEMQARRLGAVLVTSATGGAPSGILTTTDALRALMTFIELPLGEAPGATQAAASSKASHAAKLHGGSQPL